MQYFLPDSFLLVGAPAATGAATASETDAILLLVYVALALLVSFLCSIAEAVLLSIPPSYVESMKEARPGLAQRLRRIKQDKIDQSLAAILTLNTIAHTVGALGAGAKATVVFGSAWFGIFSALMTLMILFFSEIVPKTFGAVYWTRLVAPTTWFVQGLIVSLYPIVWASELLTRLIARGKSVHVFSREEFLSMARIGEQTGHLHGNESRMIRNLFRFDSLTVQDIMTPRTVVAALPVDMTLAEALDAVTDSPFSRFPLYRDDLDTITGFVLKDDVLMLNAQDRGDEALESISREIVEVLDSLTLSALLELILEKRQHIAIVVDEYGGTKGVVTLEDLVETLTGREIMDETDNVEDMRAYARNQWRKRAKTFDA
ncbi:MAG: hemolysin family protein, partial [Opitutales bacterium]